MALGWNCCASFRLVVEGYTDAPLGFAEYRVLVFGAVLVAMMPAPRPPPLPPPGRRAGVFTPTDGIIRFEGADLHGDHSPDDVVGTEAHRDHVEDARRADRSRTGALGIRMDDTSPRFFIGVHDRAVLRLLVEQNVFYGKVEALKGISFTVARGEIVTLIGASWGDRQAARVSAAAWQAVLPQRRGDALGAR